MLDHSQRQIGLVSAFRDITEQARAEQRIRKALETMLNVAEAFSGITEIEDILNSVLGMTLATLNCERGSVHLFDQNDQAFTILLSSGFGDNESEHSGRLNGASRFHPLKTSIKGSATRYWKGTSPSSMPSRMISSTIQSIRRWCLPPQSPIIIAYWV